MELPESVTNMPPQRLLLIVGGGIAAGLAWRYYSNRKGGTVSGGSSANPYDSMQGAGNLGAFGSSLESTNGFNDSADRRDVFGSGINLPVTEWVIVGADGKRYLTNGATITPLETATATTPTGGTAPTGNYVGPVQDILNSRAEAEQNDPSLWERITAQDRPDAIAVSYIPPTTPGGLTQVYTTRGIEIR